MVSIALMVVFLSVLSGVGEADGGAAKCTVSINNQVFDVDVGRFNVREIFGDGVVLTDSFFQPIPIDEWGVTLEPLQNGASYFLVRIKYVLLITLSSMNLKIKGDAFCKSNI
jgi:hypothetical protein